MMMENSLLFVHEQQAFSLVFIGKNVEIAWLYEDANGVDMTWKPGFYRVEIYFAE